MTTETICISQEEYTMLQKKKAIADDLLLQLDSSLHDLETGKIHKVR